MTEQNRWAAVTPENAARIMERLGAPWWIAGGWAIDLFLGRVTRQHADLDLAMLRQDQPALAALLPDWDIRVAMDGVLTPWRDGDWLEGGKRHQFWARPASQEQWALEFLLEEGDRQCWVYRRNPVVRLTIDRFGQRSVGNLPYVTPEVVLLYKATRPDIARNIADFEATLPSLERTAKDWLRQALAITHPRHIWIDKL